MKRFFLICCFLSVYFTYAQKKERSTVQSTLTHANVYYGYGAELNHKAQASLKSGMQELVIKNIANNIDANTLQIACPENIVIMSYRHNIKYATGKKTVHPATRQLNDSLLLLEKELKELNKDDSLAEELLQKTVKLIEIYAGKATAGTDIIKLVDYHTNKIQFYRNQRFAFKQKRETLVQRKDTIREKISEIEKEEGITMSRDSGELVLQLMTQSATVADFDVTYFTRRAGWIPAYDMRVATLDNSFKLVYKAAVTQTTGIDWKKVKLTLSAANPNQGTNAPMLHAWYLQEYVPVVYKIIRERRTDQYVFQEKPALQRYGGEAEEEYDSKAANSRGLPKQDKGYTENVPTDAPIQKDEGDVSAYTTLTESQLNTSFEINLPYDILSDGKEYSVAIKEENIKATYKHYAIPKLDKDAFLMAELSEWENLNLLPGNANIILDNVYLGKSFIDPNTTLDTLNLSLGRDKRVSITRTLVKELAKNKVRGDNKFETFTYEIALKNNKKQAVTLSLKDQYPLAKAKEIEVNMEDAGGATLSTELGILNWDLTLQPGEIKKIRFTYSVKYPKNKTLSNLK